MYVSVVLQVLDRGTYSFLGTGLRKLVSPHSFGVNVLL
jgi:hypothetical protein